jgi:TatD DNase family protein
LWLWRTTIRWEVVKQIAKYVKEHNGKTRINTDGHGNLINKRDITPEMSGFIDTVSISLNSTDPEQYASLCAFHQHACGDDRFCKKIKSNTQMWLCQLLDLSEVDTEKAKRFVTEEIGVNFREREYFKGRKGGKL